MRKSLTINIPKPCHENWDSMTQEDKGRHCEVCKKTVYDFTNKTDEQIVKTFEKNNNLCGRFKAQQLDREIVLTRKEKNNFVSIAASSLFAFMALGSQEAKAQGEPKIVKTKLVKHDSIKGKVAQSIIKEKTISGTIIDKDNLPLPGVNIAIKGTDKGVSTDFDGNFILKASVGDILVLTYLGFKTQEIIVTRKSKYSTMLIEDEQIMGEMIVVGMVIDSDAKPAYVYSSEELEEKRQRKFREENGYKFYKRKMIERFDSLRAKRANRKKDRQKNRFR